MKLWNALITLNGTSFTAHDDQWARGWFLFNFINKTNRKAQKKIIRQFEIIRHYIIENCYKSISELSCKYFVWLVFPSVSKNLPVKLSTHWY